MKKHKIEDMEPGEVGFAYPWACYNGELNGEFPIFLTKAGAHRMRVECLGTNRFAIIVDLLEEKEQ